MLQAVAPQPNQPQAIQEGASTTQPDCIEMSDSRVICVICQVRSPSPVYQYARGSAAWADRRGRFYELADARLADARLMPCMHYPRCW